MESLNTMVIIGRLTKDPVVRETKDGNKVVNITLAVDRKRKDKNGERKTDFLPFTLWGSNAERLGEYSKKGALIKLEGFGATKEIEKKDGYKETVIEPVIESYSHIANVKTIDLEEDSPELKEEKSPKKTKKAKEKEISK